MILLLNAEGIEEKVDQDQAACGETHRSQAQRARHEKEEKERTDQ